MANYALSFDGSDDYVELSQLLTIFDKSFTVSMWIKGYPEISGRWGVLLGDVGLGGIDVNFELHTNGKTRFYWMYNPDLTGTKTLQPNTWYLITFVRDKAGQTVKSYVNAEVDINYAGAISDKTATVKHRIGRDNRTGDLAFGPGLMDDVRIYNRALSADEIQALYFGKEVDSTGLVGWWKFDEGSGTTAIDSSGNGNNGTLMNGPTYTEFPTRIVGAGSLQT